MEKTNMAFFTIVSLIVSFLGGGIISALINWIRIERAEEKERKIRFLQEQIQKLYGPLYYLILQSEKLFDLEKRLDEACTKEYVEKQWSSDDNTQKTIDKDSSQTIKLKNEYISKVEENNIKIRELLDKHYSYIDSDDINTMMQFFEHHIRITTEFAEDGKLKTPRNIYRHMGNISFLRPEVIEKIKEKFSSKKLILDKLLSRDENNNPMQKSQKKEEPMAGVEIRAKIDTENVKGLLLINGGGAVALLAFLPSILNNPSYESLARAILLGLLLFSAGLITTLLHNHLRRRCSLAYSAHGIKKIKFFGLGLSEPWICHFSHLFMYASYVLFIVAVIFIYFGGIEVLNSRKTNPEKDMVAQTSINKDKVLTESKSKYERTGR